MEIESMSVKDADSGLKEQAPPNLKNGRQFNLNTIAPFAGLIIVFLLFALTTNGSFIAVGNLQMIIIQSVIIIIAGTGSTFTMAHGNIDFSLGGQLVLICMTGYYAAKLNPVLLIPACIIAGIVLSSLIGLLHIVFRLPTFVLGLCMMFMGRGFIKIAQNSEKIMKTPSLIAQFDNAILYVAAIVVIVVIAYFLFEKTKLGIYNKAIGSNPKAAFLSGIPVSRYKMYAFIISGTTIGIASILYMIKAGGLTRATGNMLEIDVLLALILGGMSLTGGSKVRTTMIVIGAFLLTMISNGMIIWGLGPITINIVKAIIFISAVGLSYDRSTGYIA